MWSHREPCGISSLLYWCWDSVLLESPLSSTSSTLPTLALCSTSSEQWAPALPQEHTAWPFPACFVALCFLPTVSDCDNFCCSSCPAVTKAYWHEKCSTYFIKICLNLSASFHTKPQALWLEKKCVFPYGGGRMVQKPKNAIWSKRGSSGEVLLPGDCKGRRVLLLGLTAMENGSEASLLLWSAQWAPLPQCCHL